MGLLLVGIDSSPAKRCLLSTAASCDVCLSSAPLISRTAGESSIAKGTWPGAFVFADLPCLLGCLADSFERAC